MKKITLFVSALFVSGVLFSSCGDTGKSNANEKSESAITAAKKEIEQNNRRFEELFAKGDSAGVAELYTSDAKFMNSGGPSVVGRPAIQSMMGGFMRHGLTKVEFTSSEVFGSEELLAEEGRLLLFVKDQQVGDEKYLALWKKEDGKWKIFRDISNSNLPQ